MKIRSRYGNYVVQNLLTRGRPHDKDAIVNTLAENIMEMSTHRCGSNTLERALIEGSEEQRSKLIRALLGPQLPALSGGGAGAEGDEPNESGSCTASASVSAPSTSISAAVGEFAASCSANGNHVATEIDTCSGLHNVQNKPPLLTIMRDKFGSFDCSSICFFFSIVYGFPWC